MMLRALCTICADLLQQNAAACPCILTCRSFAAPKGQYLQYCSSSRQLFCVETFIKLRQIMSIPANTILYSILLLNLLKLHVFLNYQCRKHSSLLKFQ